VHGEHVELLGRPVGVLDLVGHSANVLSADAAGPLIVAGLAAVAGFSQLFSP
jgi:hypothetical protein